MALWSILLGAGSIITLFKENLFEVYIAEPLNDTERKADGTAKKNQSAQHIKENTNSVTWLEFMTFD